MSSRERLDALDRRIAATLQLNGRASWRDIAEVVGSTETTVSRRAQRMLDAGAVRIAVSRTPACFGRAHVATLYITCVPGAQAEVAARLAKRPDVWSVGIFAGNADIICQVTAPSASELAHSALVDVQRVAGVASCNIEPVSRTFKLSYAWARELLDDTAADRLEVHHLSHQSDGHVLGAEDEAIINALQENARASFAVIAQGLGMHESTVRRRIEALLRQGCINVATFVDPEAMGFQPSMLMKLVVQPKQLEAVAEALAVSPNVRYVSASLGVVGVLAELTLSTRTDVYEFCTRTLSAIDGISTVQIWVELLAVKRAYTALDDVSALDPGARTSDGAATAAPPAPVRLIG